MFMHNQIALTFGHRRDHKQHHADGASTASGNGDQVWVSTERADVPLHPSQRYHLVLEAVVTRRQSVASTEEP